MSGAAIPHPDAILLPGGSRWEGTSRSPALLAVLGLGEIAAPDYAPAPCREIISFRGKKTCKNGTEERFPQEGTICKRNCVTIQGNWTPRHPTVLSTREALSIWEKFGFKKIFSFAFHFSFGTTEEVLLPTVLSRASQIQQPLSGSNSLAWNQPEPTLLQA